MTIIANQQVYTFLSATDTFVLATNGKYTETFKKEDIDTVLANKDEQVPEILYEKSVFNATERDFDGTEYTNKRS
jgi:hypothetical protein